MQLAVRRPVSFNVGPQQMERDEMAALVASWAASEPLVKRAYIFGSRARGDHNSESDLDVALELQPQSGDSGPLATWISEAERLRFSLARQIPVTIDLHWYGGAEETPPFMQGSWRGVSLFTTKIGTRGQVLQNDMSLNNCC